MNHGKDINSYYILWLKKMLSCKCTSNEISSCLNWNMEVPVSLRNDCCGEKKIPLLDKI